MAQLKCDNCGEFKVTRTSSEYFLYGGFFIVFGLFLAFILIGIPILFFGLITIGVGWALRLSGKDGLRCKKCGKKYPIKELAKLKVA